MLKKHINVEKLLNKLSFGFTPSDLSSLQKTIISDSTYKKWVENQIFHNKETLDHDYKTIYDDKFYDTYIAHNSMKIDFFHELAYLNLEKRIFFNMNSKLIIKEMMVNFLLNHFYISPFEDKITSLFYEEYENTIRKNPFGQFDVILKNVMQSVGMLSYLNNTSNMIYKEQQFYNENYARELLELHTIGVNSGYTQSDVIAVTKALTGHRRLRQDHIFTLDTLKKSNYNSIKNLIPEKYQGTEYVLNKYYLFQGENHDYSDKTFMGNTINGTGTSEIDSLITILNKEHKIAKFISNKLATYFIGKEPSKSLYDLTLTSYIKNNGNLSFVVYDLLTSDEYINHINNEKRFKTPHRFVLASSQLIKKPNRNEIKVMAKFLHQIDGSVFSKITPDGISNIDSDWNNFMRLQQYSKYLSVFTEHINIENKTKINTQELKQKLLTENFIYS